MLDLDIKEYLSQAGIRRIHELDTALIETFGQDEGEKHIERMTKLYDQSENRLIYGAEDTPYLHRQQELVDYLNQSLQMSLLAASYYDRIFFKRVLEYLVRYDSYLAGDLLDIGCGNGILTCFLALCHPEMTVAGLDLSQNAILAAEELAARLAVHNVHFYAPPYAGGLQQKCCDTLFSCRTVHENVQWRALCEEPDPMSLPVEEQTKRHSAYAKELAARIKPGWYLISVERYEEDNAYAGLCCALERAGLCPVRGTHMQFSCKNGDNTATFQAMVFQKTGAVWREGNV